MKLKNLGRAALALAASAASILGMTSCSQSYTVGYFFVTGAQYNQIASYKIQNNTGQLKQTNIVGTGGTDPIQIVINSSGTYLYVLNAGPGTASSPAPSQIDLFAIGGGGVLTHQATFTPQGTNTKAIALSGNFLYALDEFAPSSAGSGVQTYGDISAFAVDPNTGRLSTVVNTQEKDSNNQPLTYFPVGTNPIWLAVSGGYAFIAEGGVTGSSTDPQQAIFIYAQSATNGQLTLTQSTPTPTGASHLTYVYATGTTLYALDAGEPVSAGPGQILPYTVGSSGGLNPVPGGARVNNAQNTSPVFPSRIIKEATHGFLWVANSGISTVNNAPASVVTAYTIQTNGQLFDANSGGSNVITVGTGPSCIVEDPTSQYVYTANFNDSSISGKSIDRTAGFLATLPKAMPAPPGSPTWCAISGSTF